MTSISSTGSVGMSAMSAEDQKHYLKKHVDSITAEERKLLGDILVYNNIRSCLAYCSEGTVINLDILPREVLDQMYDMLRQCIDKYK